jgi:5-methylcytosine-specific restriction endonuclease McrA
MKTKFLLVSVFSLMMFATTLSQSVYAQKYRSAFKASTYRSGSTTYYAGQAYRSTGLPKVQRSTANRNQFLRSKGYTTTPKGYEVDHIVPLHQGGSDSPSNMQLLPKEVHRQKTARERRN